MGGGTGYLQLGSENISVGIGSSIESNRDRNISIGANTGTYTDGDDNIIIGNMAQPTTHMGVAVRRGYNKNIIIGNTARTNLYSGSENIIIGYDAGPERQFSSHLFIGTSRLSNIPLIGSTLGYLNKQGIRNIWTKNGYMGIWNITPLTPLHISRGTDAANGSGGYLTIGSSEHNIVLDNNEIMARTFTNQPNALYLNNNVGEVVVGSRFRLAFSEIDDLSNVRGQIRYNTSNNDFEGYDGSSWYSLTTDKTSFASSLTSSNTITKGRNNITNNDLQRKNKELESRISQLEHAIEELLRNTKE